MPNSLYACPACQAPLSLTDNTWRCANNHSYDRHKKGYVNLLLAHHKKSKAPGDDSDMVQSRRRFLEAGYYQPLADCISKMVGEQISKDGNLFDAGCGEGYYTQCIASANSDLSCYGLDISKPAIAAACKHKGIQWSVASSSHAPYLAESFDAIVSVFSRIDSNEFYRLLKPGGGICLVAPDCDHLNGLRGLIYDDVRPYDADKHRDYFDDRFELSHEQRLEVPLAIDNNQNILDLLGMTPHAHRLPLAARTRIAQTKRLDDKGCFKVYWFRKK